MLQTDFEMVYESSAFEVVHIDVGNNSASELHDHWDADNPTFPVLVGGAGLYGSYGNGYIPYNAVIDPDGVLRYTGSGFEANEIHAAIGEYLDIPTPAISLQEIIVVADDNGDGRPDPGETAEFSIVLQNNLVAQTAHSVTINMHSLDPMITILEGSALLPAGMEPGEQITLEQNFRFTVDVNSCLHWSDFTFEVISDYSEGTHEQTLLHEQRISRPDLLLVDADGGASGNEAFAVSALEVLGRSFDLWSIPDIGSPSIADLAPYSQLIWLGGSRTDDVTSSEREALSAFASEGRLLLMSSQFAGNHAANAPLLADVFGVSVNQTDTGNTFITESPDEDPWFGGIRFVLTGGGGANNCTDPDQLEASPEATVFVEWSQNPYGTAGTYKVSPACNAIYCGFPIEAMRVYGGIPEAVPLFNFLDRVFTFHAANYTPPVAPAPVTDLSIRSGPGWVALRWSPVEDAVRYRLYVSDKPYGEFEEILTTPRSSSYVFNARAGRGYYHVRADSE